MVTQRQGITLFTGISLLIGTIVVIQIWLVAAAIDALYSGNVAVLVPAAIASLVLFAANGGLLLHTLAFDRRWHRIGPDDQR